MLELLIFLLELCGEGVVDGFESGLLFLKLGESF
jgi:hypothetical protein